MQNWLNKTRPIIWNRTLNRILLLSLLGALLWACKVPPMKPEELSALPHNPIVVHSRDCVWMIDGYTNTVTHGPFCLSGFWEKVVIGDVQIASNGHLYISILESWNPEKGAGQIIIEFDPTTPRKIREIAVPVGPQRIVMDNDNLLYVSTQASKIVVVDLQTSTVVHQIVLDLPCSPEEMVLDSNGMLYASACKALTTVDTTTNSVSGSPMQFATSIDDIAVGPDGYLYVLLFETIYVVDPAGRETVANVNLHDCDALDFVVTDQGKAYVTCYDKSVVVIDTTLNNVITLIPLPYRCSRIAAANNGKVYLVGQDGEKVLVLGIESNEIVTEITLPDTRG
jgi:hypothetical protein